MEFFDVAAKRFSYRGAFKDTPIPKEDLMHILNAAIQAPAGKAAPSTSYVVVTDPAVRGKLAEIFPHPGIASAPVNIVVVSEVVEVYAGKAFEVQNYSVAVENILLAATALGYASVWTEGVTADGNRPAEIAKLLGIPAGKTVRSVLPIGVPETVSAPKEKGTLDSLVHYNQY